MICFRLRFHPRFRALFLGLMIGAFATPATAQLLVIGKANAANCYDYAKRGDKGSRSALDTCNDALDENLPTKTRAATLVNRGILRMRKERYSDAIFDYESALELQSNLTEAHVNLAAALIYIEDYDGALRSINIALEDVESKTRPAALVNRAILYDRQEQYKLAYRDLKAADILKPDWDMVIL